MESLNGEFSTGFFESIPETDWEISGTRFNRSAKEDPDGKSWGFVVRGDGIKSGLFEVMISRSEAT